MAQDDESSSPARTLTAAFPGALPCTFYSRVRLTLFGCACHICRGALELFCEVEHCRRTGERVTMDVQARLHGRGDKLAPFLGRRHDELESQLAGKMQGSRYPAFVHLGECLVQEDKAAGGRAVWRQPSIEAKERCENRNVVRVLGFPAGLVRRHA